ncbi:MAG: TIR domain-containing protein [Anaerolineales bacterium]|nr:TIR domain-containing protein [Anaerolineales bacterium]
MAEKRKSKVFISYSRKNKAFVRKLNAAIDAAGLDAWVDWDGIPLSVDWMNEITNSIISSDALLFVVSPDSLRSDYCLQELELAIQENKKIIPVVYYEPEKRQKVHKKIASSNWVFMRPKKEKFKEVLPKLIETIFTDFDWVSEHTRLSQRAAEWNLNKRNNSYMLQGSDLENAEKWMTESTTGNDRQVTLLQAEYIRASRENAIQRQKRFTRTIGLAMVVSILLFIFSVVQWRRSIANAELAQENALIAAANERIAIEQQALAEENAQRALDSENQAKAQRSAAQARTLSERPGELDTSTLLALESLDRFASVAAEDVLKKII